MLHYNVWFSFKDGVDEQHGLTVVAEFLRELCASDEIATFRLLRNTSGAPRSKLPKFQALVEYPDAAALGRSMKAQHTRGIHAGAHGKVVEIVSDFRVEVFTVIDTPPSRPTTSV